MTELDKLGIMLLTCNESVISDTFTKVKSMLKNLLDTEDPKQAVKDILGYIKNLGISKFLMKKVILSVISILLSLSYTEAADIAREELNTITKVEQPSDKVMIKELFEMGEYTISKETADKIFDSLEKQAEGKSKMNASIIVTISDDPSNPQNKNFASDDTPEEKEEGGTLLSKRKKAVTDLMSAIQNRLTKKFPMLQFTYNVKTAEDTEHYLKVDRIDTSEFDTYDISEPVIDATEPKEERDTPEAYTDNNTGGGDDITGLSRNYQFAEILKLGGISAKKFDMDKISEGDSYSKWIRNTRKHTKRFLRRLKSKFPEYAIDYKDAKVYGTVKGARKGVSNRSGQYTFTGESFLTLEQFNNKIVEKWQYVLGRSFPHLTEEQAYNFETNIETMLDYLEQMYGQSALIDFKWKKIS